jgi:hypothetical protein
MECPRKLDYARDSRYFDARENDKFLASLAEGRGHAPVWRVLIEKDFNQWAVEPVLSPRSEQKDHHPSAC